MKTRIIVDSTSDLMPEVKERVNVVPLTLHFGEEEYIDGVTIDRKTFYEKLIESDVLPKTSQATPAAFEKEFEQVKAAGECAVVITLSSKLSGTYQSAIIAAQEYENIYVVDSGSAAIGGGILVELALLLLDTGMSAEEIAKRLEIEKAGGVDFRKSVLLGYTGISDALLRKHMEDSKHLWGDELENLKYTTIGSVIGTHAGPEAVAVAFFKK